MRRLALLLLAAAAAVLFVRRREPSQYVDVDFEDGSSIRLARGIEADDLLDDAYAILEAAV
jgi:hypothetical protein